MKNNILKGFLLSGVLTLTLACETKKEEPVVIDKEQIKKEIQAKENEFASVYNSGELTQIGYYADDAVSYSQNHAPIIGKQNIIEFLKENISSTSNKIEFKTGEVFVSPDGNQVVETGDFEVKDSTATIVSKGNYMSLFVKKDGKYACLRDMSISYN
jgi:ketosteroid isomerase-like protein